MGHILSTLVAVGEHALRGPVLGEHRGNQLSEFLQGTALGAAGQRERMRLVLCLIPIVHLHEVLPGRGGQGRQRREFGNENVAQDWDWD